jgi:hypothetical protein
MKSQGLLSEDRRTSSEDPRFPAEDPRPTALQPQAMPTAEVPSMSPRLREQALPEKEDDRFFDRWAVDKARELGARAVKRSALAKLREAVRGFAEWRSLRHGPAAERANVSDRELVASTDATIVKAEAEARRLNTEADRLEDKAGEADQEVEALGERLLRFAPALRGSDWDFNLVLLANAVVFGVDIFIIHLSLGLIPGSAREYWLTALAMGAGAVVVGDVLGWVAAAGSIRKDGSIGRPSRPSIAVAAGLLILAVWFFVELGDFREDGILALARQDGVRLGNPTFFTIAQILFVLAAAAACFAYVARRHGREAHAQYLEAVGERDAHRKQLRSLRERAERARRVAAEAPALRKAAQERIRARERIAAGDAEQDIKQGEYLQSLIEPEYMRERADVESGVRYWQVESDDEFGRSEWLLIGAAVAATLFSGGLAFLVVHSVFAAVVTGAIVAGAFALASGRRDSDEEGAPKRERRRRYVAQMVAAVRNGKDRAGDIERLVPIPPPSPASSGSADGNGRRRSGRRSLTEEDTRALKNSTIRVSDDG